MFVNDTIKLAYMLFYNQNWVTIVLLVTRAIDRMNDPPFVCCLICGVLSPGKLLASPKVADPLTKHLLFGCWSSPVQPLPTVTWVESTIATRYATYVLSFSSVVKPCLTSNEQVYLSVCVLVVFFFMAQW